MRPVGWTADWMPQARSRWTCWPRSLIGTNLKPARFSAHHIYKPTKITGMVRPRTVSPAAFRSKPAWVQETTLTPPVCSTWKLPLSGSAAATLSWAGSGGAQ